MKIEHSYPFDPTNGMTQEELLAVAPYFPEYQPFALCAGLNFKVVPPDIPNFQIDFEALEKALNANTQAIILNSPNNPAGTVYTAETLKKLAALLEKKSQEFGKTIYIVADEPYRELVYGGITAPWIPGIYDHTIVCYSWSKSLSLPGERIGYVYVPEQCADHDELYAAVAGAARAGGHVCAPSLMQKVIARCVGLRPDLKAYDENRRLLSEALASYGYEMAKPDGAFYLFIKAPGGDANAFSEKAKKKETLEQNRDMLDEMKKALGDKVADVRISARLRSHPVCLTSDGAFSLEMEKILGSMPDAGQNKPKADKVLEINANHAIFEKLRFLCDNDKEKLAVYADILFTQAMLIEGMAIEDPVDYCNKVCGLM